MDAHVAHCEHETLEVANSRYRLALGAAMEDLGMAEFPNATARTLRGPDGRVNSTVGPAKRQASTSWTSLSPMSS